MSWFQDLAGKAENILTKIDKNAATVLQNPTRSVESADVEPLMEVTAVKFTMNNPGTVSGATRPETFFPESPSSIDGVSSKKGQLSCIRSDTEDVDSERSSYANSTSSRKEEFFVEPAGFETLADFSYSVEKELASTRIHLAEVKSERDGLRFELDSTQSNASAKDLENRYQSLLDEWNELHNKLILTENANTKYMKSISELESTITKHAQNEQELRQKLEMARMETTNIAAELQQYRIRAHATLQLKEKMIDQLKEKISSLVLKKDPHESDNSEQILLMELEQLKNDRSSIQEEIAALNEKYEKSKSFWQSMEHTLKETVLDLERKICETQQKLNVEHTKTLQLDDDLNIRQKELLSAREELNKQRIDFSIKMHEKESEINKLKTKIQNRPTSPSSDLELRLNSLTQSLVQKQTTLESITAERNALRLQLEKLDAQYRSTVTQIRQQRLPYMCGNETDDAKSQVPNFMVENPFDNNVARRVKRAYSSLDSIGVRLGVFLRRYPLIRILVIVYVVVLHLWVMFVLLSSTPT